jgi:hypothetical protein
MARDAARVSNRAIRAFAYDAEYLHLCYFHSNHFGFREMIHDQKFAQNHAAPNGPRDFISEHYVRSEFRPLLRVSRQPLPNRKTQVILCLERSGRITQSSTYTKSSNIRSIIRLA